MSFVERLLHTCHLRKTKKARIPDSNKVGIIMVILAILRRYSV
nr:MAG TPA: hypothetical protein [Caudoviricetes sp.]